MVAEARLFRSDEVTGSTEHYEKSDTERIIRNLYLMEFLLASAFGNCITFLQENGVVVKELPSFVVIGER